MPEVTLVDLFKRFGKTIAVDHINLTVKDKELVSFLGPSGCGKTTMLRMLAGFVTPDDGEIYVGGRLVSSSKKGIILPPEKRNMSMVFQNYALWPNMKVFKNVSFGLEARKIPKAEIKKRVTEAVRIVSLEGMEDRYPHELSGGQQQRVALARAFITEPDVLLLDEPLSNLDATLREKMRFELKDLQRRLGITTIYVTHDQAESMVLSDSIVLMGVGGKVEQNGKPKEIYERPQTGFVASFMGAVNFLGGQLKDGSIRILDKYKMSCEIPKGLSDGSEVTVSVRPENIYVHSESYARGHENTVVGTVIKSVYLGNVIDYRIKVDNEIVRAQCNPSVNYPEGANVSLEFDICTIIPEKLERKASS